MADGGGARVPQHDLDAEGAVLAAVFEDRAALDEVQEILTGPDFYADANRRIFDAILELVAIGQPPDVVTVAARLREQGRLAQIGGMPYLAQLAGSTPSTANVAAHARIVADKARQRQLVAVCQKHAAEGYGDVGNVSEWAQGLEAQVFSIAQARLEREPAEPMSDLMPKTVKRMQERKASGVPMVGLETGWVDVTRQIGGWEDCLPYVIAGRPGMGKTAFMLGACINVARPKENAPGDFAFFGSAEMPKEQLAQRALAAESNVPLQSIRGWDLNQTELNATLLAAENLRKMPLVIDYLPGATVATIRSSIRRASVLMKRKPRMIAIDYLQILKGERQSGDSRDTEVAGLMRGMVWIAAEFGCPVLVGSQLNRDCEKRPDKRPQLSDLRESGGIEQDAYAVCFFYRDEYYNKRSSDVGVLEAIWAKLRNGATGTVKLHFQGDTTRISNLANEWDDGWDFKQRAAGDRG